MSLTGQTKSSATTMTNGAKNFVSMAGLTKPGAGWDYDDPFITYDGATDNEGRAVLYDSIGQTTTMTPLTKNNV